MNPSKISLIILTIFFAGISLCDNSYAKRGCCSWHQGANHCDKDTGRIICNDGSYSPSCLCEPSSQNPKFRPNQNSNYDNEN
jgi:hypothetical protein